MKNLIYLLLISVFLASSCATAHKRLSSSSGPASESNIPGTNAKRTTLMPAGPVKESETPKKEVKEVREKLVPNNKKLPDEHQYFVIIGSFRSYANALKQQTIVSKDGFSSEILKNEAGLYRVSVKATDDINEARDEVRRIWAAFPKYSDTWMLVRIK